MRGVWTSDQERKCVGHCANVSTDVDRVRDEEQADEPVDHQRRVVAAHVPREPVTAHATYFRAHKLYGYHERIGKEQRPKQAVSELRTALRIGGDPTRIVVRSTGDQAGAKRF